MAENATPRTAMEQGLRAWQEGMNSLARAWTPQGQTSDAQAMEEGVKRIVAGLSELTNAQVAVTAGWLQLPFAVASGNANGVQTLQAGYARLVQAYNVLFQAYLGAGAPLRRAAVANTQTAATAAAEETKTSAEAASSVIESAGATANAAAQLARDSVAQAVQAADATRKAATNGTAGPLGAGPIKGKIGRDGGRIYHQPGQANYDRFIADMLFATEQEAQAAGFRPSQR